MSEKLNTTCLMTFLSITIFYFFESAQMSYFNVLAPSFANHQEIASLSAAYYYGDMAGLFPAGLMLDRFPLRKTLLWSIFGSVIGAFLLLISKNFYMEWSARFLCGFFGGTFSFVGGIRVLSILFKDRFTFFIGLFLSAGMLGGLICQYPLLIAVNHFGIIGAMSIMAVFGLFVVFFNIIYLQPIDLSEEPRHKKTSISRKQIFLEILKNYRNWFDCIMIVFLDTPVSIIGTLWGIVLLKNLYHFSEITSAWIVMSLFLGLMVGLPIWGELADRYKQPPWIVIAGASGSFIAVLVMLIFKNIGPPIAAIIFFFLGLFSSCQTLGFTWLIKNMKPELIGRNSAFNSMIFMGSNGGIKQLCAFLLTTVSLSQIPSTNLLILITITMIISAIYAFFRKKLFNYIG